MTAHTTTAALQILIAEGPLLSHAEFRLIWALGDNPDPSGGDFECFEATMARLASYGFSDGEVESVVSGLAAKALPIGTFEVISCHEPIVRWRLP